MDSIFELIVVDPSDYESFRCIPARDIPETFNEFLQLTANHKR